MVFKEFFKIWKKESLMNQALNNVNNMFEHSHVMFKKSVDALMDNKNVKMDVYKRDKKLNVLEVDTRKKIFEHLAVNRAQDTASSLILVEVVRDLERIGDFSKNIVEINMMYPKKFGKDKHTKVLFEMKDIVFDIFANTKKSFKDSNKETARQVVDKHNNVVAKKLDSLIENIVKENNIKAKEAIAYVLLSRYLKRVSAHLTNIASSVVNPFHRIRHRTGHVSLKG